LTKKRSHSWFISAQRAVLLQEYEEHEELLSRTRYDDPDAPVRELWESVARAVSAVEENTPPKLLSSVGLNFSPSFYKQRNGKHGVSEL